MEIELKNNLTIKQFNNKIPKYFTKIIILLIIMAFPIKNYAQKFKDLHRPEKIWIITHPFVVLKSWKISKEARQISNGAINDPDFDGDYNGGQVDAYRHTLWMAMLTQKMSPRKAEKLGIAHEKGNKIDYDKKLLEEGKLPDSVACEMDLRNNRIGIDIGKANKKTPSVELQKIVKKAVMEGKCWKINKNIDGLFLDKNDNIIPEEDWKGKWISPKILVPSNK